MGFVLAQAAVARPHAVRAVVIDESPRLFGDDLLAKVALGDQAAFAALYDHLASAAFGLAQRVVRNPALAEEITQDAFLQVWSTGPSFDRTRGSARSWVMTIVHRRAVDIVRHEQAARARLMRVGVGSVEQPFDAVWAASLQRSEQAQVLAALALLSAPQRQAVELAYFEGLTCQEVATCLQVPLGTAKSRIHDGVRRLRRSLLAADR